MSVLPSVSGIVMPAFFAAGHTFTREHFVNRPDIEFLRRDDGLEVYPFPNATQIQVGKVTTISYPTNPNIQSGVAIFASGGAQFSPLGTPIVPPNISGIAAVSGLPHT